MSPGSDGLDVLAFAIRKRVDHRNVLGRADRSGRAYFESATYLKIVVINILSPSLRRQ